MYKKLLHKDVWFPDGIQEETKTLQKSITGYQLSQHFEDHIKNQQIEDRSHTYLRNVIDQCIKSLKSTQREVFEVEVAKGYYDFGLSGWFITKYCCRIPYNKDQDLVIVIRPHWNKNKKIYDSNINLVVTAWMNNKNDTHYTLDSSKYATNLD